MPWGQWPSIETRESSSFWSQCQIFPETFLFKDALKVYPIRTGFWAVFDQSPPAAPFDVYAYRVSCSPVLCPPLLRPKLMYHVTTSADPFFLHDLHFPTWDFDPIRTGFWAVFDHCPPAAPFDVSAYRVSCSPVLCPPLLRPKLMYHVTTSADPFLLHDLHCSHLRLWANTKMSFLFVLCLTSVFFSLCHSTQLPS